MECCIIHSLKKKKQKKIISAYVSLLFIIILYIRLAKAIIKSYMHVLVRHVLEFYLLIAKSKSLL